MVTKVRAASIAGLICCFSDTQAATPRRNLADELSGFSNRRMMRTQNRFPV